MYYALFFIYMKYGETFKGTLLLRDPNSSLWQQQQQQQQELFAAVAAAAGFGGEGYFAFCIN